MLLRFLFLSVSGNAWGMAGLTAENCHIFLQQIAGDSRAVRLVGAGLHLRAQGVDLVFTHIGRAGGGAAGLRQQAGAPVQA